MNKKILILDIDGTLTNSRKEITPKTLKAMLQVQEAGHIIMIASGRPTHGVKWVADALQLEKYGGYILSFNGARITNAQKKEVIYQQLFPKECMESVYKYALSHDMGFVTYENTYLLCGTRLDEYMELEAKLNHLQLKQVDSIIEYVDFDINKCLMTARESEAPALEQELAGMYRDQLSIYRSEPFFIEAMPPGIDKAASLERLFQMIDFDKKDAIACGDGFNDMSMIQYAGLGVAMANAQEDVKKGADLVTKKSNDEDGLLEIVENYLL